MSSKNERVMYVKQSDGIHRVYRKGELVGKLVRTQRGWRYAACTP